MGRSLKISKSAAAKYASMIRAANVDREVAQTLIDQELEARLYRPARPRSSQQLALDFATIPSHVPKVFHTTSGLGMRRGDIGPVHRPFRLAPRLGLVFLSPVSKLVLVNFDVNFHDTGLQPRLDVRDGLVVNGRTDFFQKKSKQGTCLDISNLFVHVFQEVAFNRRDSQFLGLFGDFNSHAEILPQPALKPRRLEAL